MRLSISIRNYHVIFKHQGYAMRGATPLSRLQIGSVGGGMFPFVFILNYKIMNTTTIMLNVHQDDNNNIMMSMHFVNTFAFVQ